MAIYTRNQGSSNSQNIESSPKKEEQVNSESNLLPSISLGTTIVKAMTEVSEMITDFGTDRIDFLSKGDSDLRDVTPKPDKPIKVEIVRDNREKNNSQEHKLPEHNKVSGAKANSEQKQSDNIKQLPAPRDSSKLIPHAKKTNSFLIRQKDEAELSSKNSLVRSIQDSSEDREARENELSKKLDYISRQRNDVLSNQRSVQSSKEDNEKERITYPQYDSIKSPVTDSLDTLKTQKEDSVTHIETQLDDITSKLDYISKQRENAESAKDSIEDIQNKGDANKTDLRDSKSNKKENVTYPEYDSIKSPVTDSLDNFNIQKEESISRIEGQLDDINSKLSYISESSTQYKESTENEKEKNRQKSKFISKQQDNAKSNKESLDYLLVNKNKNSSKNQLDYLLNTKDNKEPVPVRVINKENSSEKKKKENNSGEKWEKIKSFVTKTISQPLSHISSGLKNIADGLKKKSLWDMIKTLAPIVLIMHLLPIITDKIIEFTKEIPMYWKSASAWFRNTFTGSNSIFHRAKLWIEEKIQNIGLKLSESDNTALAMVGRSLFEASGGNIYNKADLEYAKEHNLYLSEEDLKKYPDKEGAKGIIYHPWEQVYRDELGIDKSSGSGFDLKFLNAGINAYKDLLHNEKTGIYATSGGNIDTAVGAFAQTLQKFEEGDWNYGSNSTFGKIAEYFNRNRIGKGALSVTVGNLKEQIRKEITEENLERKDDEKILLSDEELTSKAWERLAAAIIRADQLYEVEKGNKVKDFEYEGRDFEAERNEMELEGQQETSSYLSKSLIEDGITASNMKKAEEGKFGKAMQEAVIENKSDIKIKQENPILNTIQKSAQEANANNASAMQNLLDSIFTKGFGSNVVTSIYGPPMPAQATSVSTPNY